MSKWAIITGATSGIGKAYSILLAEKGYNLIITGRREELLSNNRDYLINTFRIEVESYIVDFSKPEMFHDFLGQVSLNKQVEFLVNNVGFSNHSNFFETDFSINEKMIDVHIRCLASLVHTFVPIMKNNGSGFIVNISSLAGFLPSLSDPFYSGTKSFINTYSESISMILKSEGIKVQSLCPGFTRTDFHKKMNLNAKTFRNKGLKRWMNPEDVVDYSFRKLSRSSVIVIPGIANKILYYSLKIIPKCLYYKLAGRKRVLNER